MALLHMTSKKPFVAVVLVFVVLGGCTAPPGRPGLTGRAPALPTELYLRRHVLGRSVEGRAIGCLTAGKGPDVTFILATIHGDEPAGTMLLQRLASHLQQKPHILDGRKVMLLPIANPDGVARTSRLNARAVDLNRNFAADNRTHIPKHGPAALSEPEARIIDRLIRQYAPDRIVSIHQVMDMGPKGLARRFPNGCIDYDGPAQNLAEQMAQYCDLAVAKLGAASGSLGSYAGIELRIPVITMELPPHAHQLAAEVLWDSYGAALLSVVAHTETTK
jgi:protein MpaA